MTWETPIHYNSLWSLPSFADGAAIPSGIPISVFAWIGALAFAVNVPLGYLRAGTRRYSPLWFAYVHLSIPLIAFIRIRQGVTPWAIPAFIACAVAGQLAGGRLRPRRPGGAG